MGVLLDEWAIGGYFEHGWSVGLMQVVDTVFGGPGGSRGSI